VLRHGYGERLADREAGAFPGSQGRLRSMHVYCGRRGALIALGHLSSSVRQLSSLREGCKGPSRAGRSVAERWLTAIRVGSDPEQQQL